MKHQSLGKRSTVVSTKVGAAVLKSVDKYFSNSSIVQPENFAAMPRLNHNDVEIGKFLGQGSFGNLYDVIRISVNNSNNRNSSSSRNKNNKYLNDALMEGAQEHRFALKCLNPASTALDVKTLFKSTADLAMEAKILSSLNHKNIIKIHAIVDCFTPTSFVLDEVYGIFYIVDRMEMTLSEKIDEWVRATKPIKSKLKNGVSSHSSSSASWSALPCRLKVALEIASGLQYLHSLCLMHRDIKPENVGFDINGNVKIFDLGTSKEIHPPTNEREETSNPTGLTGTVRYMAPEVALSKYYDLSADVYSFGILLWEVCSLKLPFKKYNTKKHLERVVRGKERPKLNPSWSAALQELMCICWSDDPRERPDFEFICYSLRMEISSLSVSSSPCGTVAPALMAVDNVETTENGMVSSFSTRPSFRFEKNGKNSTRSKRSLLRRASRFASLRTSST